MLICVGGRSCVLKRRKWTLLGVFLLSWRKFDTYDAVRNFDLLVFHYYSVVTIHLEINTTAFVVCCIYLYMPSFIIHRGVIVRCLQTSGHIYPPSKLHVLLKRWKVTKPKFVDMGHIRNLYRSQWFRAKEKLCPQNNTSPLITSGIAVKSC